MRKESVGLILIGGLIGVVFFTVELIFLFRGELNLDIIALLVLDSASALILAATIYFIYRQARSTEKLAEITSQPQISVGIMSPGKSIRTKKADITVEIELSLEESLERTRLIINSFSNFTAFVWTRINLKTDNKDANEYLKSSDFCSGQRFWEIDPHAIIRPFILKSSILKHLKDKKKIISISISIYCSSNSKRPKNPEWIELNSYSFRRDSDYPGQWVKSGIGVPYLLYKP